QWLSIRLIANLDIGPAQPFPPAGAQALEDCLLGGPAAGKVFGRVLPRLAVTNFPAGIDAVQEQFAVLLDHPCDAHAFHDVCTDAYDVHGHFTHARLRNWCTGPIIAKSFHSGTINPIALVHGRRTPSCRPRPTCSPTSPQPSAKP